MQRSLFTLSFGFAALLYLTLASTGWGQTSARKVCAPREVVLKKLRAGFGERRQSIGLSRDGTIVEVFASPATGTWTITATFVSGTTCIVTSGRYFEMPKEKPAPSGVPA